MTSSSELKIDLRQMVMAIETAVSLVGMNDTNHGKRVGYIASQLGYQLGYDDETLQFLFDLGLLHDCGVSSEQMHTNLVNHFDWKDSKVHCEVGFGLLKDFEPLKHFATPILYHHTHWEDLKNEDISEQDALFANIIFLADRIDVSSASHYEDDILLAKTDIIALIKSYAGTYFNPILVDAFEVLEKSESFWIALENRHITRHTWDMGLFEMEESLTMAQIKQLSLIMAYIVDQKSPFTAEHSLGVANVACFLGALAGLSVEQCQKIEIAGLLHDLGKLHTPDNILEKNGPLNDIERSIINQHSYETFEILRHIKGLNEISRWAAFHHESLNGSGYPFHLKSSEISTEARIIAVADIFQALVQDRPYRKGMSLDKVISILDEFVESGKLDKDIVALATQHQDECLIHAKGSHPTVKTLSF